MTELDEQGALAQALIAAIRGGDVAALRALLADHPGLAAANLRRPPRNGESFTYPVLMAATDFPGNFPNAAETIATLVAAGADVDATAGGAHAETALHWAASCDDVAALDALLDLGAAIDAPGAVIAGGTALDDAVAFAQWRTARRLAERGAATALHHAAALGLTDRIEDWFAHRGRPTRHPWGPKDNPPRAADVAFWCACHGGQRAAAEFLLARGADPRWRAPWDGLTPAATAARNGFAEVAAWARGVAGG